MEERKTCNFARLCPEIGHDIVQVQVQLKMILFPVKICAVICCTVQGYNDFDHFEKVKSPDPLMDAY
jgi:hypothetical protein